jgi:hypothetical protein
MQGIDPGAGPSGGVASSAAGLPVLTPSLLSPWLSSTGFPGMGFPGLFGTGFPGVGSFGTGSFGGVGGDIGQAQFQPSGQEPSTSNMP